MVYFVFSEGKRDIFLKSTKINYLVQWGVDFLWV